MISLEVDGQVGLLSWFPSTAAFEKSAKNHYHWTEVLEVDYLANEKIDLVKERKLERTPLSSKKWHNSLRGSSDVHQANLHINKEALKLIQQLIK